ncbi:MAG: D-lysine 5,6-aminomutase subunit alpha, partial [Deltaproteobacteria bacterium]
MSQLFVEAAKIARARELAQNAARGVQAFIDRHTTVAIERTVLRLLGIGAAGTRGAPLANLIVDQLAEAKVLQRGAA